MDSYLERDSDGKECPSFDCRSECADYFLTILEGRDYTTVAGFWSKQAGECLHENAHFAKFFDFQGNLHLNLVTMALDHFTKVLLKEVFPGKGDDERPPVIRWSGRV